MYHGLLLFFKQFGNIDNMQLSAKQLMETYNRHLEKPISKVPFKGQKTNKLDKTPRIAFAEDHFGQNLASASFQIPGLVKGYLAGDQAKLNEIAEQLADYFATKALHSFLTGEDHRPERARVIVDETFQNLTSYPAYASSLESKLSSQELTQLNELVKDKYTKHLKSQNQILIDIFDNYPLKNFTF